MMPEASPFWQNAFLVGIVVVMGWSIWSGWRAGIVRTAVALGGMFAGGAAGMAVGGSLGPLLGKVLPLPGLVLGVIVGLGIGIAIYAVVRFLGALLFKRTAQQKSLPLRLVYGGGGGLVGAFVGLTVIWGVLLFVRGLGGFYQGAFEPTARHSPLPPPNAAEAALVKLKRSVEAGSTGRKLAAIDVMPAEYYRIFDKLGRVTAQPEAARRLMDFPEIRAVMNDPLILAITADPDAADAARLQNYGALMKNQTLLHAANDPALIAKLQKIDIEKALDYALAPPPQPRR